MAWNVGREKEEAKKAVGLKWERKGKYEEKLKLIRGKRVEKAEKAGEEDHLVSACHVERNLHNRMVGTKELFGVSIISVLLAASLAYSSSNDGIDLYDGFDKSYGNVLPLDPRMQYLIEAKRSVNGIKNLIDELHSKLEKRTACMLDGGLSASCNHKDAVEAGEHHRFLASSFAPGRRKRSLKQSSMDSSVFYT